MWEYIFVEEIIKVYIFQVNMLWRHRAFFLVLNDTHRKKLCFTQFNTRMTAWLLLTFFKCLKNYTKDFQNSPSFVKSACFYVTICGNIERFQYLNFETNFLQNEKLFQETGVPFSSWDNKDWKCIISIQNCHTRSQC